DCVREDNQCGRDDGDADRDRARPAIHQPTRRGEDEQRRFESFKFWNLPRAKHQADAEINRGGEGNKVNKTRIPPAIEKVARREKQEVLRAKRQHAIQRVQRDEENEKFERVESHLRSTAAEKPYLAGW